MAPSPTRVLLVAGDQAVHGGLGTCPTELRADVVAVCEVRRAKKLLEAHSFDVLVVDLSQLGSHLLELLRHARRASPACKIILISGVSYHREIGEAFALGASDYLQRPVAPPDLHAAISRVMEADGAERSRRAREELGLQLHCEQRRAALEGIQALVCAVEARDPCTQNHSTNVARYASHLAKRLDLPADKAEPICVAALVHDVGKIGIPDSILTAPGELTQEQFECVRRHPGLGEYIVRNLSGFDAEARIVRHHHENWDGSGYPDGLSGRDIPLGSRLIRIADAIDAMLTRRSYRTAYPVDNMLDELRRCPGREFDPKLAAVALEWCTLRRSELVVPASDGEPALTKSL